MLYASYLMAPWYMAANYPTTLSNHRKEPQTKLRRKTWWTPNLASSARTINTLATCSPSPCVWGRTHKGQGVVTARPGLWKRLTSVGLLWKSMPRSVPALGATPKVPSNPLNGLCLQPELFIAVASVCFVKTSPSYFFTLQGYFLQVAH